MIASLVERFPCPSDVSEPVGSVLWVPVDMVEGNDYNPNSVAPNELRLLYTSISHDGYTQPVVTVYDDERDVFVIVDGFHRWLTMKRHREMRERTGGLLPVVVIDKSVEDRMASTVRHNRARGRHSVTGMAQIVFSMLDGGCSEEQICAELGLEGEELLRLKYVTGFARLFEHTEYRRAWETRRQIELRKEFERDHAQATPEG